jgi:hypothetical protein
MPRSHPVPQFNVTGGSATGFTPLRQRLRSAEPAGFVAEHVQVMLEIQHMRMLARPAEGFDQVEVVFPLVDKRAASR